MLAATVNGLISGAVLGLVAIGLVLVYKGARVFNFAQGEFGTVAAFAAWLLHSGGASFDLAWAIPIALISGAFLTWLAWNGWGLKLRNALIVGGAFALSLGWMLQAGRLPLGLAMLAGVVAGTLFGLVLERLVVRPLHASPRVILLVATAGVAIGIISLQLFLGEAEARILDPIYQLETATGQASSFFFFGVAISAQQLFILGTLLILAPILWWFFSRTDLGLAVLATSQDDLATRLAGIGVNRMSAFVWGFAAFLGAVAGVLVAPIVFVAPGLMTGSFLFPAFAAAVLGGMTSLPGAFIGGLLVGVARDVGAFALPEAITGGAELTVFGLLLLVLLIRPQGLLGAEA